MMRIVPLPQFDALAAVHAYFLERYEDPTVISRDFMEFWIKQGKTPQQIFQIATNRRES
jgi:hypothetical protein